MKRIKHQENLESTPSPYQYFDLIAGTGTGAVQACMLGRLRMPVHSAIESYAKLTKEVFSERKWFSRSGTLTFKTSKLKDSLMEIIQEITGNPEEPIMESQSTGTQCRTLVFAMSRYNMRAGIPTAFRSYPAVVNEGPRCAIWEALCATMAHPDLFKSFDIGSPSLKQSFVDAGLGCNNPLAHVLIEAKMVYPERHVSSVTSIGTGLARTIQVPDRSMLRQLLPTTTIQAMKDIAEDAEKVAEDMARRFSSTSGIYFRLSVDQGMQIVEMDKWDQRSEVAGHTRAYMRMLEVKQVMDKATEAICLRKEAAPTARIDGEIWIAATDATPAMQRCPAPTPNFTGCEPKLRRAELSILGSERERKVCVVYGIGGAGKTQLVLKVVERTYDSWKEVIYIDASTQQSIETMLKAVAIANGIGNTYHSVLQWLEAYREPWLLVLDNVDDPSILIHEYMPRGNHGSIIITTRLPGIVLFARGTNADCSVSSMDPKDALTLLLKCARRQIQRIPPEELDNAITLLEELGHFALAIVHAGSFIGQSPHMSITEYRSLFIEQRREALEAYSQLSAVVKTDTYGHTVYTTWLMCYNALSPRAQQLLSLISFLHHTGITINIFRRAASYITSYRPRFPTTELENMAQRKLEDLLGTFLGTDKHWDGLSFSGVLNEILSRSLLDYEDVNQGYRIHPLVQDWVRTVAPYKDMTAECTRSLLAMSAASCVDESLESIQFLMSVGLHVSGVLPEQTEKIGTDQALVFSRVYEKMGQWKEAERLHVYVQESLKQVLGNEHPDTLASMHALARSYSFLGRYEDARALFAQVVDTTKRVLGNDHPDTLTSMHELAGSYSSLGRYEEARALFAQVVDTKKRVLGNDHPDTLASMHELARSYSSLGRYEDARALFAQVVDTKKRVLGNDHPNTLASMHELARSYSSLGRYEDARALFAQVVDTKKRVLGNDHPDTLASMHELAGSYSSLGRYEDARALFAQVVDTKKQVLGNDHPETLKSIHDIADVYLHLGLTQEARNLQINLDDYIRLFGENHPWVNRARELIARIQTHRECAGNPSNKLET
ncbi:Patatin-like phospholipase, partial [Rhizoctonia solani]